ncbi:MAG: DUF5691 domain-containing protein [Candidatus Sumerlaeia bacterium]|nr:DUF5691 domain-containing protein [Candidatus Sumerlaeia bacterium]
MDAWNETVRAALVGTERQPFTPPALPAGMAAALKASAPADALAACAGLLGTWRAAGRRAAAAPDVPPPFATEPEDLPTVRPPAARLWEDYPGILEEAMRVLASRGLIVPAEAAPALLDHAAKEPGMRGLILPVLGKRGLALGLMRPEWRAVVAPVVDPDHWEGSPQERAGHLRIMRATDPAKARAVVEAGWKGEHAKTRSLFVRELQEGLGPGDEAFLEACLDDRSKDVAKEASLLLAQLRGSAFIARMNERARGVLRPGAGQDGGLGIEPPKELDAAGKRDCLELPAVKGGGVVPGARGRLLTEIATKASLEAWTDATGMSPRELIAAVRGSEWAAQLDNGWLDALQAQQNVEWARAYLELAESGTTSDMPGEEPLGGYRARLRGAAAALPEAERLRRTIDLLGKGELIQALDLLPSFAALRSYPLELSRAVEAAVVAKCRDIGRSSRAMRLLYDLCWFGAPSLYPEFLARWKEADPPSDHSAAEIDRVLRHYELRYRIHEEAKP